MPKITKGSLWELQNPVSGPLITYFVDPSDSVHVINLVTGELSSRYWGSLPKIVKALPKIWEGMSLVCGFGDFKCINPNFLLIDSTEDPGTKYIRTIRDKSNTTIDVDVYDVLEAFGITCPAMQHGIKKILCTGLRGHKDFNADIDEAVKSFERAKELQHNREQQ